MMRRIDDLFAREKRKAATGKTDADYAKLPLLMKFEDRARYVQDTYRTSSVCVYVRLYVLDSGDQSLTIFFSLVSIMQTAFRTTSARTIMDTSASGRGGRDSDDEEGEDEDDACSIMSTSVMSTLDPITRKPMNDPGRKPKRSRLAKITPLSSYE